MQSILRNLLFGILVATTYSEVAVADEPPQSLERGARLYSENCGRCHNARGPSEYDDRQWPIVVTHMRVLAGLPGDQARAIESFLRASNNPPPRPAPSRAVEDEPSTLDGETLFQQFGCRGCHVVGGSGGTIGPSLDGLFERRDEAWIHDQVQNPKKNNPKSVMPQFNLSDEQVRAIIEVLRRANSTDSD